MKTPLTALAAVLAIALVGCSAQRPTPVAALPAAVPKPPASTTQPLPAARPLITTLDNGVMVAILENRQAPVASVRVYIKAGAMMEGDQGRGMTHLLEHLVAGGTTPTRPEEEGRRLLDAIGAESNAYTSNDHACYYITTAARFYETAVDLLADWTMNCTMPEEEFQRELEVIQREMESRRSDPNVMLHELMNQTLFQVHPARYPVLGFRDSFRHITRDEVYNYYRATYVPDNILVVVAGDVSTDDALAKVRATFGGYERRPVPLNAFPKEPPQLAPREALREAPAGQAYLMLAWHTIPLSDPDLYALDLLSFVLSEGDSSRLVRDLREEQGLVSSIASWSYTPGFDAGEFAILATLQPDKLDAARAAILAQVRRLREELVTPEELQRAKRQKVSEHAFSLQTVEAQASSLASDILSAHDPDFSRLYVERIQRTTAEELRRAAQKYLTDQGLCVAIVRPPSAIAAAQEKGPAAEVGEIAKSVLPNGLRLLVKRNPAQPLVSIQAYMLAGVRAEPAAKTGLSLFTARMMERGTPTRNAEEIARAFDEMGGSMSVASGYNALYLSAACLTENFEKALEISADVLRRPNFPEGEVERLRPQILAAVERRKDNWREVLGLNFRREFFANHPYQRTPLGESATLSGITRDDAADFHISVCLPNNTVLAIFGDVDPDRARELATKFFADWPAGKLHLPSPAPEPAPAADRTATATGPANMGGVFVGYPGLTVADEKDRYAMDVLDALTSGISLPRGWLHAALRGKGLVYEVHAYSFAGLEPGFFGIYAGTEPGRVEEVKGIILEQMGRLFAGEIPAAELDAARQVCVTAAVLDRQTNAEQGGQAALDELYGLGYDASARYEAGVLAVTAADVRRVAAKYLTHYVSVLMTPAKE